MNDRHYNILRALNVNLLYYAKSRPLLNTRLVLRMIACGLWGQNKICYYDNIFAFLAASLAKVTPGPTAPTFVGGVAVFTAGAGAGAALMSHLLLRFRGSSPVEGENKNLPHHKSATNAKSPLLAVKKLFCPWSRSSKIVTRFFFNFLWILKLWKYAPLMAEIAWDMVRVRSLTSVREAIFAQRDAQRAKSGRKLCLDPPSASWQFLLSLRWFLSIALRILYFA